jgi:hypothetical protein
MSQPTYARNTTFAVKVVSLALALTLEANAASLQPYTGNTQMLDLPPSERATQFFPLDHIFQLQPRKLATMKETHAINAAFGYRCLYDHLDSWN